MGKPGLTADRSCSGALSRHIVHRVAMHVPWQKRHFDAVVPKMAKQTFAFPASTRTMFLNWKVKPLDVAYERHRHKPAYCKCSICSTKEHGCCEKCTGNTGPVNPCPNFLGIDENLCKDENGNLQNAKRKQAYIADFTAAKHGKLCNNQSIFLERSDHESVHHYKDFVHKYYKDIAHGTCPL